MEMVQIYVKTPNHWNWKEEMLWAVPVSGDLYEIRSIPVAAYGISRGDIVRTVHCSEKNLPEIRSLETQRGHHTIRIIFTNPAMPWEEREKLLLELKKDIGIEFEKVNQNYAAVDVLNAKVLEMLTPLLDRLRNAGIIAYETCERRSPDHFGENESDAAEAPDLRLK